MAKPIPVDFGIYAFGRFQKASAMLYYRLLLPLRIMNELGLANIYVDDGGGSREEAARALQASDLAVSWNPPGGAGGLSIARSIASMKPVMAEGALQFPTRFIVDMDDAIEHTHPLNTAFGRYGTLNFEGGKLKPGDEIWWAPPGSAQEDYRPLWVDKVTLDPDGHPFDIERNNQNIEDHYESARLAAGVAVSTPALAKLYKERGIENVHVFPNSIHESDYFFANLAPHDGVRILWQGGSAHFDDWMPIKDAFIQVMRENPQAKFVSWGANYKGILKELPESQIETHGWDDYNAYKVKRPLMDADINLCPLVDNKFNECKSAIKWYEGSVGPRPELTIAANVGPYREIENGKTGLLYNTPEEFADQLRAAIKNAELRRTIAFRGQEWVRANRDIKKTVLPYYEFMMELKRQQRMEAFAI